MLFECPPEDALGRPVRSLLDDSILNFEAQDALAEIERDGLVYEVRTSPINDRHGQLTGHTLVVQDITARKRRERRLADQHARLERLDDLNAAIRGVHRALVTATSRGEIRRAVCTCLTDSGLYRTACAADIATIHGSTDDWTVSGTASETPELPPNLLDTIQSDSVRDAATVDAGTRSNPWTVVPLVYGPTVYGILAVQREPEQSAVTERERDVLVELGELIGHASNAVETRQLLTAESVVELEFRSRDTDGTLLGAAKQLGAALELRGFVPNAVDGNLAYIHASGATSEDVVSALTDWQHGHTRAVRDGDDDSLVEWSVPDETLLGILASEGAHICSLAACGDQSVVTVEVASDADVRKLVDTIRTAFPDTSLSTKRTHDRPVAGAETLSREMLTDLTDRQQEVLETAYHAGYFDWPRGSTAEEVAETLGITAPTLHAHLRKAEATVFTDLLSDENRMATEPAADSGDEQ
jgi:predicted DNA binding protein